MYGLKPVHTAYFHALGWAHGPIKRSGPTAGPTASRGRRDRRDDKLFMRIKNFTTLANEFRNDLDFLMPRTARNIQRAEHERFALDQG